MCDYIRTSLSYDLQRNFHVHVKHEESHTLLSNEERGAIGEVTLYHGTLVGNRDTERNMSSTDCTLGNHFIAYCMVVLENIGFSRNWC